MQPAAVERGLLKARDLSIFARATGGRRTITSGMAAPSSWSARAQDKVRNGLPALTMMTLIAAVPVAPSAALIASADRVPELGPTHERQWRADGRRQSVERGARQDRPAGLSEAWAARHVAPEEGPAVPVLGPRIGASTAAGAHEQESNDLAERRAKVAQALARLAEASREIEMTPELRARILALGPLILEQVRRYRSGPGAELGGTIEFQGGLRPQLPLMLTPRAWPDGETREQKSATQATATFSISIHDATTPALVSTTYGRAGPARWSSGTGSGQVARSLARIAAPAARPSVTVMARGATPVMNAIMGLAIRTTTLAAGLDARQQNVVRAAVTSRPADPDPVPAIRAAFATRSPVAGAAESWLRSEVGTGGAIPGVGSMPSSGLAMLDPAKTVAPPWRVGAARLELPIMPVPGRVISEFGDRVRATGQSGMVIDARLGQAVAAPEDGQVAFAGQFKSYGLLLIIEHAREYHTLLWGFSRLEVSTGDDVRTGQIVGVMGMDGDQSRTLHVELRRNGRPVNPLPSLAESSSKVRG